MKAQQPHKNTIQLVALATTAAPSTFMFWNIDGAAKHLFIFFGLISNIITWPLSQAYDCQFLMFTFNLFSDINHHHEIRQPAQAGAKCSKNLSSTTQLTYFV